MRTTVKLIIGTLFLAATMNSFGFQTGNDSLYTSFHVDHYTSDVYSASNLADYILADFIVAEEAQPLESWMVVPFVYEEEFVMESWMSVPFMIEEEVGMESWMSVPFMIEEEVGMESWMSESWE